MKSEMPESTKKPYQAPELSVYGDVREITLSNQSTGNFDNPSNPMNDMRTGG
jgi:hypothetical protein